MSETDVRAALDPFTTAPSSERARLLREAGDRDDQRAAKLASVMPQYAEFLRFRAHLRRRLAFEATRLTTP